MTSWIIKGRALFSVKAPLFLSKLYRFLNRKYSTLQSSIIRKNICYFGFLKNQWTLQYFYDGLISTFLPRFLGRGWNTILLGFYFCWGWSCQLGAFLKPFCMRLCWKFCYQCRDMFLRNFQPLAFNLWFDICRRLLWWYEFSRFWWLVPLINFSFSKEN